MSEVDEFRAADSDAVEPESTGADAVAGALAASMDRLDPLQRRLAVATYRSLAGGESVPPIRIAELAETEVDVVEAWLGEVPGVFRDEADRVVGFWGLTVAEMDHRLLIGELELYAWCAWDTLFIPPILGREVDVVSTCRATGDPVRLRVGPAGVSSIDPGGASISMLVPGGGFDEQVMQSFCHHIHFFRSAEAGERWLAETGGLAEFLMPVSEGFRLGTLWNAHRLGWDAA